MGARLTTIDRQEISRNGDLLEHLLEDVDAIIIEEQDIPSPKLDSLPYTNFGVANSCKFERRPTVKTYAHCTDLVGAGADTCSLAW